MTPKQLKAARKTLKMSAETLAQTLWIGSGRTVRRWEAGDRKIPGPVKLLIGLMKRGDVSLDRLRTIKQALDN